MTTDATGRTDLQPLDDVRLKSEFWVTPRQATKRGVVCGIPFLFDGEWTVRIEWDDDSVTYPPVAWLELAPHAAVEDDDN